MQFNLTSYKLTGNPGKSGWTQAYEFKPEDEEKLKLRGQLFAIISTSNSTEGIENAFAGREVLMRLHEEYFGKTEAKPFYALKSAVQKVIDEFSSWDNIEISAVSFVSTTVNLASGGGAEIFILRDKKLKKLVKSEKGKVVSASGYGKIEDLLIITTSIFVNNFNPVVIESTFKDKNPPLALELLAPEVHMNERGERMGILAIKVDEIFKPEKINNVGISLKNDLNVFKEDEALEGQEKREGAFNQQYGSLIKNKRKILDFMNFFKKKNIYVKNKEDEVSLNSNKKTSVKVGVLLLLILSVSIYFGIIQRKKILFKETYESQISSAEHELIESQELYSLNPQRARELFNKARSDVLGMSDEGIDDIKVTELKEKIEEGERKILGEYNVIPKLFVDLNLLTGGFSGDEISYSKDSTYILDRNAKKIVSVSISSKRAEIISGPPNLTEANHLVSYVNEVYILNSNGMYSIEDFKKKILDKDWSESILADIYSSNLYILDKEESKIYRYSSLGEKFEGKKEWLSPGISVSLSEADNWAIDGYIWILTDTKEILKFSQGNPQNFTISGIYPETETIKEIYTNEELQSLYLLDAVNGRILVIDKNGEYKAQYINNEIKSTNHIVVSEKEKKIILLNKDKLLSIDIEHI